MIELDKLVFYRIIYCWRWRGELQQPPGITHTAKRIARSVSSSSSHCSLYVIDGSLSLMKYLAVGTNLLLTVLNPLNLVLRYNHGLYMWYTQDIPQSWRTLLNISNNFLSDQSYKIVITHLQGYAKQKKCLWTLVINRAHLYFDTLRGKKLVEKSCLIPREWGEIYRLPFERRDTIVHSFSTLHLEGKETWRRRFGY